MGKILPSKYTCFECGSNDDIHHHHVIPESLGGSKTIPLCVICYGKIQNAGLLKSNEGKEKEHDLRFVNPNPSVLNINGIDTIIKKHLKNKFVSSVDYRDKINLRGHPKFKWYKPDHSGFSYVGVYFLYDKNELVYIGYTTDVCKRLTNHRSGFFKWTKVRYVDVGDELNARKLEFALLVTNKTKYNSPKYVERRIIRDPYNYWWTQRGRLSEIVKYSDKRLKPHYQKMLDMSFEEFEEQHKLKMSGEPHDLAIL